MNRELATAKPVPSAQEEKPFSEAVRAHVRAYFRSHDGVLPLPGIYKRLLPLVEKPLIEETLAATQGNQLRTAEILGINRNTLRKKILELGIDPAAWIKK